MNRGVSGEHDRMLSNMIMPGFVVGVDLVAGKVRIQSRDWVSPWVRWHAQAAGKARHWRAPSMGERGTLINPSGVPSLGRFIPGLYSDDGPQPDNRDHVEVWRFDDGGSLVYDWEAKTYNVTVPTGTVTIQVGQSTAVVTDNEIVSTVGGSSTSVTPNAVQVTATNIGLNGETVINGGLHVTKGISSDGSIMDAGGNSNHHAH